MLPSHVGARGLGRPEALVKIKKLEVVGFKSFVDRTVVHFDHDVTGIVGPNGCGKSNVVDAIKWVMGEQSPKMLRGGSMNDVIFNGSEVRGPAQFAEVSLTFDNNDALAPPEYRDYAEITVSRRLDRQGRSDYFINRTPVRLLDITNLFLGTGVGRRAYSIIEQGRIGYIVTSKPEDRRTMIEEAAGVTKFKAHKKAAERKMDQTRQNLTRVDDILRELEKSLASLKRQAQKAERYKEYRAELRDLELFVGSFRYLESFTALKYVNRQLERDEAVAEGVRLGMRVREVETETERLAVDRATVDVERAQQVTYALDNEVKMREARIRQLREKLTALQERELHIDGELEVLAQRRDEVSNEKQQLARALENVRDVEDDAAEALDRENEALAHRRRAVDETTKVVEGIRKKAQDVQKRTVSGEARVEAVMRRRDELSTRLEKRRGERENLAAELVDLEQQRGELAGRLDGLRAGKEASAERRAVCETELVRLREEATEVERVVDSLRDVVAQKRSRLRSLLEIQEKLEGVGGGTRAIMTRYAANADAREAAGIRGLVADLVECDEAHQAALAGVLGDRLEIVVVDALANGVAALDWLRRESKGRASLVLRDHLPARSSRGAATGDGSLFWLVERLRFAPADRDFVERLLGEALVVDDLAAASRLAPTMPGVTFVTLSGEVFGRDGVLAGGQADDAAAHRLAMKREARELETTLAEEGRRFDEAVARQGEVRRLVAERQAELEVARRASHDADLDLLSVEKDLARVEGERNRMRNRVEDLAGEVQDLAYEASELDEQEAEAREVAQAAREEEVTVESEMALAERNLEDRREAVEMQNERVTEVRLRVSQIRERASADRASYERVLRSESEMNQRASALDAERIANAAQQGRIVGELHVDAETLFEQVASARHAQEILAKARSVYDDAKVAASQSEAELKILRANLEEASSRVNKLSLRRTELSMEIQHLVEGIVTRHDADVRKVLRDYHDREVPTAETLQRIDELTRLIDRMGPINLLAIDEFDEQNGRFEVLSAQRKDLLDALAQLDRAIRQMNKESRALFKEAFEAIDARFRLVFPQVFRGGEAKLVLTNPDDLLESGIDIVAQPPGKKLGSLELMSGGEKALTAVALIFAIFQFKPSPFCILDEVDAPLDEANIARFADAVRQMTDRSQFIVITHSKRTMETTDVLYGVTMEQPGISKLVAVELRGNRRPVPDDRIAAA